jgi:hypothetical protein
MAEDDDGSRGSGVGSQTRLSQASSKRQSPARIPNDKWPCPPDRLVGHVAVNIIFLSFLFYYLFICDILDSVLLYCCASGSIDIQ